MKIIKIETPRHEWFPAGSKLEDGVLHRTSPHWYDAKRQITKVVIHQTAGGTTPGVMGVKKTAAFCVAHPPKGRGFPSIPYHYFIPYRCDGTVYQPNFDGWHTFHCKGANTGSLGVALQGLFVADEGTPGGKGHPSEGQMELLAELWEHLKQKHNLDNKALYGHKDFGKPGCPGGTAYAWIKGVRG